MRDRGGVSGGWGCGQWGMGVRSVGDGGAVSGGWG